MKFLASSAGALAMLAIPFAFTAEPARTQTAQQSPACGERSEIVASLGMQYRESQQAVGVVDPNTLFEIFVSDSGSWTAIATDTRGMSCIVFYGEGWDSKDGVADAAA
jgi:hypothetical protein